MKSLAVYCGSSVGANPGFQILARELGTALAARGVELVYGGSHVGLMGIVADAVLAGGGQVYGVLPRFMADKELAHRKIQNLVLVDSMHERKRLMADRAEGFVALPGGFGTLEEIFEAVTWAQLHLHRFPCGFLNPGGYFDPLHEFLRGAVAAGFVRQGLLDSVSFATSVAELFDRFATFQPETTEKWIPTRVI